jgi:hypothetical protein
MDYVKTRKISTLAAAFVDVVNPRAVDVDESMLKRIQLIGHCKRSRACLCLHRSTVARVSILSQSPLKRGLFLRLCVHTVM